MQMPATQTFSLVPHPAGEDQAVRSVSGHVSRAEGALRVSYRLVGEVDSLRLPGQQPTGFADELWRHTCFELFVAPRGEPRYHEFNFSPSRQWAAYGFSRYRERVSAGRPAIDPDITVQRSGEVLELTARVRLDPLWPRYTDSPLLLGLSAVIERGEDGLLSYWALRHPCATPDFHHPDGFALEL